MKLLESLLVTKTECPGSVLVMQDFSDSFLSKVKSATYAGLNKEKDETFDSGISDMNCKILQIMLSAPGRQEQKALHCNILVVW